jgi:hypothetical protein
LYGNLNESQTVTFCGNHVPTSWNSERIIPLYHFENGYDVPFWCPKCKDSDELSEKNIREKAQFLQKTGIDSKIYKIRKRAFESKKSVSFDEELLKKYKIQ